MAETRNTPKSRKSSRKLLAPAKPSEPEKHQSTEMHTKHADPDSSYNPIRVVLSWYSPERVWKPKTQVWYLVSALVIMILILLAVKLEYYVFVLALLAFLLLWFVQGSMAPLMAKHQITTQGVFTNETFHRWEDISYFWFTEHEDWYIVYLDFQTNLRLSRATMLVKKGDDDEIFNILIAHLKYGEMYEVGYNIFAKLVYGTYVPITKYIPDLDQPNGKELKSVRESNHAK